MACAEEDDNDVRNDVDDEVEEDDGYVEAELDIVNPNDANVVLDECCCCC